MEDGERENELFSPTRDLHQTTSESDLPVLSRSNRPLEMKEERVVNDVNDHRKPSDGEGMELMAPPSHPVHLFEKQPSDVDTIAASWPQYANFAPAAEESCAKPSPVATLLLASTSHYHSSFSLHFHSSAESKPKVPHHGTAELLMAITSAVQEQAPRLVSASDEDNDEEEEEEAPGDQDQVECGAEHDQLKAAIRNHPLYPEMVLTHLDILKIGAPSEVHDRLEDFSKKFQRSHAGRRLTSKLDPDSELDNFMKSYVVTLSNFRDDLEEPVNKFMQFADKMTKDLEDLCGHYVETKPEEEDHGFGIDMESRAEGAQNSEEYSSPELNNPPRENSLKHYNPTDIDESIIVDPDALEEDLKKALMKKFGRHISGLTAEFNRARKKGKLPDAARRILKDWFNDHCHWPYPSEMEKEYLQQLCELSLKQINNWFINERKRHWNSEGRSMYPSLKPNEDDGGDEGTGHVEQ